jgi:hypothetical protein
VKILLVLLYVTTFCALAASQTLPPQTKPPSPVVDVEVYTSGASPQSCPSGICPCVNISNGFIWHQLSFVQLGSTSVTGCEVQIDSSPDQTTIASGGILPGTPNNCNSFATISNQVPIGAAWARIHFVGLSAGTVIATYVAQSVNTVAVNSTVTLPTTILSGQQAVTATAASLSANVLTRGLCVEALSTNTISVFVGGSTVTATTGIELPPGASYCSPLSNTMLLFVVASSTGASVTWSGS